MSIFVEKVYCENCGKEFEPYSSSHSICPHCHHDNWFGHRNLTIDLSDCTEDDIENGGFVGRHDPLSVGAVEKKKKPLFNGGD